MKAFEFLQEYGTQITGDVLALKAADIAQMYTQKATSRAYAVELIFFSIDQEKGSLLFKIDPAGHFTGFFATSSGVKDQDAEAVLEKHYKELKGFKDQSKDQLIRLAIICL